MILSDGARIRYWRPVHHCRHCTFTPLWAKLNLLVLAITALLLPPFTPPSQAQTQTQVALLISPSLLLPLGVRVLLPHLGESRGQSAIVRTASCPTEASTTDRLDKLSKW